MINLKKIKMIELHLKLIRMGRIYNILQYSDNSDKILGDKSFFTTLRSIWTNTKRNCILHKCFKKVLQFYLS